MAGLWRACLGPGGDGKNRIMKTQRPRGMWSCQGAGLVLGSAVAWALIAGCTSPIEEARLQRYLAYRSLPSLTPEKIDMKESAAMLCRQWLPGEFDHPHFKPGIMVYANERALEQAATREPGGRLPVGSVIVKEKYEAKTDAEPSLLTVMEKTSDTGRVSDWDFMMIKLPEGTIVRERPKVACTTCHAKYTQTDFVSAGSYFRLTELARRRAEKARAE